MKQEVIDRTKDSIRGLATLKRKGHRVGDLKFKSVVNSIPLKQYGNTWKILDKHHVHIQGIKQPLSVKGIVQIPKDAEVASALLVRKHGDCYLHVTTFQTKTVPINEHERQEQSEKSIGIDFGIKNQLTLSNGIRINYEVPVTERDEEALQEPRQEALPKPQLVESKNKTGESLRQDD